MSGENLPPQPPRSEQGVYDRLRLPSVADTRTAQLLHQQLEEKVAAANQRAAEAERREREAKEQQQEYRAETNKTYMLIGIALLSIVMFALGRASSHWGDLNAELRDVRERIAVMEALRNPSPSLGRAHQITHRRIALAHRLQCLLGRNPAVHDPHPV